MGVKNVTNQRTDERTNKAFLGIGYKQLYMMFCILFQLIGRVSKTCCQKLSSLTTLSNFGLWTSVSDICKDWSWNLHFREKLKVEDKRKFPNRRYTSGSNHLKFRFCRIFRLFNHRLEACHDMIHTWHMTHDQCWAFIISYHIVSYDTRPAPVL